MGMVEWLCTFPETYQSVIFVADGGIITSYVIEHMIGAFVEQFFLAFEIMVEGAFSDTCMSYDIINVCSVITFITEKIDRSLDDGITLTRINRIKFRVWTGICWILIYNVFYLAKRKPIFLQWLNLFKPLYMLGSIISHGLSCSDRLWQQSLSCIITDCSSRNFCASAQLGHLHVFRVLLHCMVSFRNDQFFTFHFISKQNNK